MSKKGKSNNNNQPKSTVNSAPTVIVKPSNEILTTEEGDQILQSSMEQMEKYCSQKRAEADEYYNEKTQEAESLRIKAEAEIERRVADAINQEKKKMKQEIADAEQRAREILKDANANAASLNNDLKKRQAELDKAQEEHFKEKTQLESDKISYKAEMRKSVESEMQEILSEKEQLEKTISSLNKQLKSEQAEKRALEEDNDFLHQAIQDNQIKRSKVASYEQMIKDLQADCNRLNEFYNNQKNENEKLKSQILMYGDDPSRAMRENADLQKKIDKLQSLISSCPSPEELQKLRDTSAKYSDILTKIEALENERRELEAENFELRRNKSEIECCRRFVKILELQQAELQRELDRNIELYNSRTEKVFASLSLIDSTQNKEYPSIIQNWNLKKLCAAFRGYLANREENKLFYDERTIRTFIAGFASARLMILEGLSGTGKSSLPRAFMDFMGANTIEVPVQSSWKDRNDLLGFYNDFKKQYKETEFLKALYTATHDPNNIYLIVLDEMNLSRIEYYFADLLSVLEKPRVEDWKIELISDYASITQNKDAWPKLINEGKLQISDNTWFIGTANKDDSTFMITDKVYDRSVVINFDKKGTKEDISPAPPIKMNNEDFQRLLSKSDHFTSTKADKANEERFRKMISKLDELVRELFQITFGNRIANQLEKFVPVYIACGGTVDEAIDVMFSKKVLRKLEGIYDDNTKESLELLKEEIESNGYMLPITVETIMQMTKKI